MYNDTDNQVGKGKTVRDNQEHGLRSLACTDQAGGDDQEGAVGQGPVNGSDLERGQRGQVSLQWEHLHRRTEFHRGKMATGQPGETRAD